MRYRDPLTQKPRHGFRWTLCIDSSPRRTFGNVAASLSNQPLPFAAHMQNGQVAGAKRRFLDWKAAMLPMREPVRPEVTKRPDFTHKRTNHELRRPCERYRARPW